MLYCAEGSHEDAPEHLVVTKKREIYVSVVLVGQLIVGLIVHPPTSGCASCAVAPATRLAGLAWSTQFSGVQLCATIAQLHLFQRLNSA